MQRPPGKIRVVGEAASWCLSFLSHQRIPGQYVPLSLHQSQDSKSTGIYLVKSKLPSHPQASEFFFPNSPEAKRQKQTNKQQKQQKTPIH